jgi:2-amino-4-hydroxy-6-hydroxymethyldihydropteridine diphosphokinase
VGGPAGQAPYFNAACRIEVNLEPRALLRFLKNIEHEIGRRDYGPRWGPRVIDLDILLFDNVVLKEDGLEIPHPRLAERAFVLVPLLEIGPRLAHPLLAKPLKGLLTGMDDAGVKLIAASGWEGELQKEDRLEL